MIREFCYICATKTEERQPGVYWCEGCQQNYYTNPKPCADMVLFDDQDRVLIGRRKDQPHEGKLDIPGGFLEFGETFEEGAKREIEEELGLKPASYTQPVFVTTYISDYPWGKETYQTAVVVFVARIKPGVKPKAGDDIVEIEMVDPAKLNPKDFAFPAQAGYVMKAFRILNGQ